MGGVAGSGREGVASGEERQEVGKLVCFSCDSNKAECNMTALGLCHRLRASIVSDVSGNVHSAVG